MTRSPMTRQDVPPLLRLSGAVLEAQWDRVGHITLSDCCRRPVGREKKKSAMSHFWDTHHILGQSGFEISNRVFTLAQCCAQSRVAHDAPISGASGARDG